MSLLHPATLTSPFPSHAPICVRLCHIRLAGASPYQLYPASHWPWRLFFRLRSPSRDRHSHSPPPSPPSTPPRPKRTNFNYRQRRRNRRSPSRLSLPPPPLLPLGPTSRVVLRSDIRHRRISVSIIHPFSAFFFAVISADFLASATSSFPSFSFFCAVELYRNFYPFESLLSHQSLPFDSILSLTPRPLAFVSILSLPPSVPRGLE